MRAPGFCVVAFVYVAVTSIGRLAVSAPISFATLSSGASMEGSGTVDPRINIVTAGGGGQVIRPGSSNSRYQWTGSAPVDNGGIDPSGGFADFRPVFPTYDFTFTFNFGLTINAFSVRMLDFGDFNPYGGTLSAVRVVGFDASSAIVDSDTLTFTHDAASGPTTGSLGNPQITSDASAAPGQPGNFTFSIAGANITKVQFQYQQNGSQGGPTLRSDTNFGFDSLDITFVPEPGSMAILALAAAGLSVRPRGLLNRASEVAEEKDSR